MTVGLLGLQGAFLDHIPFLERLEAPYRIVKCVDDLMAVDRLILPGGESTVMAKFLDHYGMRDPIRRRISEGLPAWGICAGAILLARSMDNGPGILEVLPMDVKRNAYGRQWASCWKSIELPDLAAAPFQAAFIRAPRITELDTEVEILAHCGPDPVFVRYGRIMATTFHPELTNDPAFHTYFLNL